jgi:crotonobetainyl-CoA:carnitine CoA-transferase CaiB-like acyl-CoA transferase
MPQVLQGITVLDFAWGMAGSLATMVLSDFGAEVIKVEIPGGDPFRSFPGALQWDRGKKSVVLDLKDPGDREQALALAQRADVLVESFRPGVAERLGIGYPALAALRPDLVYCSITGFGPRGPYAAYKGYEGVVAAKTGRMMAFAGLPPREGPVFPAVQTASHAAAMAAVRGIVAALYLRDRTGHGQKVETSLLQAISPYDLYQWIAWQMMIKDPETFPGDPEADPARLPRVGYLPARTRDGRWLQLANLLQPLFRASLQALGLGAALDDPRFATAPRVADEDRQALVRMMLARIQEKTLEQWMELFIHHATDVAAEPFTTAQEAMEHPQIQHNGGVQVVQDPRVGRMRQLGPLLLLRETPAACQGPAPDPGQHTAEILDRLARPGATRNAKGPAPLPRHPLEGVTVLDLSSVIAGPMGASLLAEMGARVVHVEAPQGDYMRAPLPLGAGAHRTLGGAEGLCLDLRTPEGQAIIRALVPRANVLVHNMRPGVPERLGIGYQQLREINPRLVYLYVAGYGSSGPSAHRPAMHPIPGAVLGGALAQAGRGAVPGPETPMTLDEVVEVSRRLSRANEPNPDPNTSMVVATGAMLALYARERFGFGQYLEVTLLGANAYANADDFFDYPGRPPRTIPDAQGYGLHALYRLYRAQAGWVFLACLFEHEWQALCVALGRPDLQTDPRFSTAPMRRQHDDALALELQQLFATRPALEWERILTAADVACVQAEDRGMYHFFAEDPHVRENDFTTPVSAPRLGEFWRYGPLLTFSRTPCTAGPAPLRGQHTQAVLQELGYSPEQVLDLRARRIVDWEEP